LLSPSSLLLACDDEPALYPRFTQVRHLPFSSFPCNIHFPRMFAMPFTCIDVSEFGAHRRLFQAPFLQL
jgi:hypothetical protein